MNRLLATKRHSVVSLAGGLGIPEIRGAPLYDRAVLALSEDDSYNAFVVLAAKELNPNVRTVAAVGDTRNTGRVARTRPDVLLTLPQLGGELLAMALSGEEIKADALIGQLLKLG